MNRFAEVADSVLLVLLDFLGGESGYNVLVCVKSIIEQYPKFRSIIVRKIIDNLDEGCRLTLTLTLILTPTPTPPIPTNPHQRREPASHRARRRAPACVAWPTWRGGTAGPGRYARSENKGSSMRAWHRLHKRNSSVLRWRCDRG